MTYPTRTGTRAPPQVAAQDEKARQLTGMNGTVPDRLAITRGDASGLGVLSLKAKHVAGTPTADQYNALVDDIRTLALVLNAMGANLTGL